MLFAAGKNPQIAAALAGVTAGGHAGHHGRRTADGSGIQPTLHGLGLSGAAGQFPGADLPAVFLAVDAAFLATPQNFAKEVDLKHAFAAREGYTAAGIFIERLILGDLGHDLENGVFLPQISFASCGQ